MVLLKDSFRRLYVQLFPRKKDTRSLQIHHLQSKFLERQVRVDVYLPQEYRLRSHISYPVLFINDGQDMEAVQLEPTLNRLINKGLILPIVVVAIHANENRMQEYGTASQADYKNRGSKAEAYTQFILQELLPFVHRKYRIKTQPSETVFAGFSLGGLSAMDIVWHHPNTFGKVGVFSGSFWWRSKAFSPDEPDADRIMQTIIHHSQKRPGLKFWFQTGTRDEDSDRNNNGIIDAIDDTLDVIRELKRLGYKELEDIRYVEVEGGEHNPATWARVLPDFLKWAFRRGL